MYRLLFAAFLASALISTAGAQTKQRIDKAADLPRFTYKLDGTVEEVVRDNARFAKFAAEVRRDIDSVLAKYDITDKAAERGLRGTLVQLDMLEGRNDAALEGIARVKALQEKPANKLLSGMSQRAIIASQAKVGNRTSDAYRSEVGRAIAADLAPTPYDVIANEIKEAKASVETLGEGRIIGSLREFLQPTVDKNGGVLSSDLAPNMVGAKYVLTFLLPLKQTLVDTYSAYLNAHKVDKPDIWAARDATLPAGRGYKPVVVAVWDSGVDTKLFGNAVVKESSQPAVIAFDRYSNPATGELAPIPADLRDRVPQLKAKLKGMSDLRSNVDSPEASALKQYFSTLKPEEYKAAAEELGLAGIWMHGTHVAGIALAGNPYAQVVVGRLEFDWHLLPDPCPSKELSERTARSSQAYVDFFRKHGVRVVNMSWGESVKRVEEGLELCNIGKTPEERKALARELFDIEKNALIEAFASAPDILFVTSAGNSNSDASFDESIPSNISLPNLITVGAVDKAGDEAGFTSYGPTVVVHASGYQVDSVIPGGERLAQSGTSMASPQVTNLAAKIVAINPRLTPPQVIAIIRDTAEKTADGRRTLINPKKALAAAEATLAAQAKTS